MSNYSIKGNHNRTDYGPLISGVRPMKQVVLATLLLTFVLGPSSAASSPKKPPRRVSIIQLLANPEQYEGKVVTLRGYVHLEFESNSISLHKEDYDHSIYSNGLWLNGDKCSNPDGSSFTSGYAEVVGRFTTQFRGHMGLWYGSISEVIGCYSYPTSGGGT